MLKENSAMRLYFGPSEERWNLSALTWSEVGSSSPSPGDSRLGISKAGAPGVGYWCCDPPETYPRRKRRIQAARESQSQSPAEDDARTNTPTRSPDFQKFRVSGKGASEVCGQALAASRPGERSGAEVRGGAPPGPTCVRLPGPGWRPRWWRPGKPRSGGAA